jgi:hypothetical protein
MTNTMISLKDPKKRKLLERGPLLISGTFQNALAAHDMFQVLIVIMVNVIIRLIHWKILDVMTVNVKLIRLTFQIFQIFQRLFDSQPKSIFG